MFFQDVGAYTSKAADYRRRAETLGNQVRNFFVTSHKENQKFDDYRTLG
jgi:hypothetical protein